MLGISAAAAAGRGVHHPHGHPVERRHRDAGACRVADGRSDAGLGGQPGRACVVLAVPLVWATFRFFRPYYLEAARTMRRGWGLLCLIPLAFYALFYIVYIVARWRARVCVSPS
ncbi:MAG: hypothetical protein ACLSVD_05685 [Eggerthellaceae bacterium]